MTNATPKVSVIIPIYNTAPYLRACLDSICQQTLRDIEIILVNDGSTDECPIIVEEYAQRDKRIKYWHQVNQGLSVSRNIGLSLATGEFIYFMDSDDLLEQDTLEQCYKKCTMDRLDVVCFDAECISDNNISNVPDYHRSDKIDATIIWNGNEWMNYLLDNHIWQVSACLTFTRFAFLHSFFPGFPVGIIHEDNLFMVLLCLHASRVGYLPHRFFKRRIRQHSITTATFGMRNIDGYCHTSIILESIKQNHSKWWISIDKFNRITWNAVIWQARGMDLWTKIECMVKLKRLHLAQYITCKNWIRFWIKKI